MRWHWFFAAMLTSLLFVGDDPGIVLGAIPVAWLVALWMSRREDRRARR